MAARISSGVQRGLLLMARQPAASTSPSAECCASWFTVSGAGTAVREMPIASSTSPLPSTRLFLRLTKRSTMNAKARMEHRMSGQIGQPAACMMESKGFFRATWPCKDARDYGAACHAPRPPAPPPPPSPPTRPHQHPICQPPRERTNSVDNFVKKTPAPRPQPSPGAGCDRLMKQKAAENRLKTRTCTTALCFTAHACSAGPARRPLWSTGAARRRKMVRQTA